MPELIHDNKNETNFISIEGTGIQAKLSEILVNAFTTLFLTMA